MYQPESEGGKPEFVFDTQREADERCRLLNLEAGREKIVGKSWGNSSKLSGWITEDCEPDPEVLRKLSIDPDDRWNAYLPEDISDEDLGKAMDAYDLTFYEVHKVPHG